MHVALILLSSTCSVASAQEQGDTPDGADQTDVVESLNQAENEMSRFFEKDRDESRTTYPHLRGDIIFRLGFNGEYEVEGEREETIDEFLDMIASPTLHINQRLRLDSEIRLETTSLPTDNRRFEDEGLFVRQLFLEFDVTDALMVRAGKITPTFALASLVTPGPFGNNYNKEIELIERLGFEALYTIDGGSAGRHTFTASTFFDDTTILSESLGSNRGRNSLDDGGASNTESFESLTLSIGGEDIEGLPGFRYQLSFISEAAGRGDPEDEIGFAIAGTCTAEVSENTTFMTIAEFAPF